MTKHKISRRDFLAALAAGTVAATACGLHRTFAEASRTFEYWVLNRELSFRRTREGIIYSCEGYPLIFSLQSSTERSPNASLRKRHCWRASSRPLATQMPMLHGSR